ncbi:MAG: hypothetical protein H7249_05970, partial [Chitinophagaceae bacterium]|nr:hypothetical protein [Oligoflexus sp.]
MPITKSFWDWWISQGMDHIKSDRERIEDKRVKTALLVAYTKAIKEASTDTKS